MAIVQNLYKNFSSLTSGSYSDYKDFPRENRFIISNTYNGEAATGGAVSSLELTALTKNLASSTQVRSGLAIYTGSSNDVNVIPILSAASSGFPDTTPQRPVSHFGTTDFPWTDITATTIKGPDTTSTHLNNLIIDSGNLTSTASYTYNGILFRIHLYNNVTRSISLRCYTPDSYAYVYPNENNIWSLGCTGRLFKAVYAQTGTIQSSDRNSKSHIHYIDEIQPRVKTMSTTSVSDKVFTTSEILDFIKSLNPCTFTYKDSENEISPQEAKDNNQTELIQLGLIADDIKDSSLFDYIGVTSEYDKVVTPEEKDDEGNVVKEAVTEKATELGLKPLPLAVLGLVANKYLLNKVEELISRIEKLESNLTK